MVASIRTIPASDCLDDGDSHLIQLTHDPSEKRHWVYSFDSGRLYRFDLLQSAVRLRNWALHAAQRSAL